MEIIHIHRSDIRKPLAFVLLLVPALAFAIVFGSLVSSSPRLKQELLIKGAQVLGLKTSIDNINIPGSK